MTYDHLNDFLSELEDRGQLMRIAEEVDPALEITEITRRVCQSPGGGPALVFERVRGSRIPVVTNLLGNYERMCLALRSRSFDDVSERIAGLIAPDVPEGWMEALRLVPQFTQLTKLPPKLIKTGLCQQVVKMGRDVDLSEFPIPHVWPDDPGPTISLGQVFTKNPRTEIRNVGLYPLSVLTPKTLAVHWNRHQGGSRILEEYRNRNLQMPVAIAFGGDPLLGLTAHLPLPPNTDECLLAGFLRDRNVELVKCRSVELEVPAHAEIVMEGYIDTSAPLETIGPIGSPTGFYNPPEKVPVLNVTAVTQRSNPIFPALIVGKPPMEDFWFGKAAERLIVPFVRLFIPELVDLHLPLAGALRNIAFASIQKQYPQQARKVMHALWSLSPLMGIKLMVIVDESVNVHDEQEVWFQAGANAHPGRDLVFREGPAHWLDHAAPVRGVGHQMGIDATRKLPEEGHPREWPDELSMPRELTERVNRRWSEYGFPAS